MQETSLTIGIAMSTYNGAKYLIPQIESILNQNISNYTLVVRDDGSSDETTAILKEYEGRGLLELIEGGNIGVVDSFFELINLMARRFDYIALCDQDDVWHADKLSRAMSVLKEKDDTKPQLYCSEYMFCNETLVPTGQSHLNIRGISFPTMLYENKASGNTMVMNRALASLASSSGTEGIYCHDWWIALVASAFGEITFDNFISLDYRRIGNNVSPTGSSALALLRYRITRFIKNNELKCITTQLKKLYCTYEDFLDPNKKRVLALFINGGRLQKALFPHHLRQTLLSDLAIRCLFLLGLL